MINDNKKYLFDKFNIDVDKYSTEELNNLLDKIICVLNESIKNKINDVRQLRDEMEKVSIDNN